MISLRLCRCVSDLPLPPADFGDHPLELDRRLGLLQARVDRLLNNADRLFALGNIREHCQTAIKMFHEDMQPSPFTPWGAMLRDNREYRFALSLTLTYTSTKDEIIQLVRGCQEEYLLQEVEEERERQIEDFARMKIASRWYQMKDDDHAWRVFSQNIPYGETGREEDIRQFFETLDRICILTDILMGHAAEYGLKVDYEDKYGGREQDDLHHELYPGGMDYSGDRVQTSHDPDKFGSVIAKIDATERRIVAEIDSRYSGPLSKRSPR